MLMRFVWGFPVFSVSALFINCGCQSVIVFGFVSLKMQVKISQWELTARTVSVGIQMIVTRVCLEARCVNTVTSYTLRWKATTWVLRCETVLNNSIINCENHGLWQLTTRLNNVRCTYLMRWSAPWLSAVMARDVSNETACKTSRSPCILIHADVYWVCSETLQTVVFSKRPSMAGLSESLFMLCVDRVQMCVPGETRRLRTRRWWTTGMTLKAITVSGLTIHFTLIALLLECYLHTYAYPVSCGSCLFYTLVDGIHVCLLLWLLLLETVTSFIVL